MLKIRQEQLDALGAYVEKNFKRQMREQLRADYAHYIAGLNDAQLASFVEQSVAKAKSYNIDIKRDVADYLVILLHHGVDFELQPEYDWALEILSDPNLEGGTKILQFHTQFDEQENQRG